MHSTSVGYISTLKAAAGGICAARIAGKMVAKKVKNVPNTVESPINFSDPSQNIAVMCEISPPRR